MLVGHYRMHVLLSPLLVNSFPFNRMMIIIRPFERNLIGQTQYTYTMVLFCLPHPIATCHWLLQPFDNNRQPLFIKYISSVLLWFQDFSSPISVLYIYKHFLRLKYVIFTARCICFLYYKLCTLVPSHWNDSIDTVEHSRLISQSLACANHLGVMCFMSGKSTKPLFCLIDWFVHHNVLLNANVQVQPATNSFTYL